ncbi:MAG: hypothetical protein Q9187_007917 [Circinaria calcarea]
MAVPPPGIYVPVPTFFVPKAASNYNASAAPLDLPTQAAHAIHLAKCGIRGIVLLGSTGEAIMVSNDERRSLIGHVRLELENAGFTNYPIIAGTATQGIEDTVQQLKDAKDAGSQWGLVLAPGYFAPAVNQDGIISWYTAIADRTPIPIMIYHYPAVSNNLTFTPSTITHLAAHPKIVGCKLSHGNLSHHAQVASSPRISLTRFATFTGLGQQLLAVLAVGGAGAIDGIAGMFPRTVVALYNGYSEESMNREELRELQYKIARAEELIVQWGTVGVKEGVSRVLGFGERDGTRLPLKGGLPDGEWERWKEAFAALEKRERELAEEAGEHGR